MILTDEGTRTVLPLLARKYLYRYVLLAIALPLVARVCLYAAARLERGNGAPTTSSRLLRKVGGFTRRRARRALGKDDDTTGADAIGSTGP
jgi:hypothetical protein